MKYLAIYLAAILYALAIWGKIGIERVLVLLLLAFAVIGVAGIAVQGSDLAPVAGLAKLGLMVALLVVGGVYLLLASNTPSTSS